MRMDGTGANDQLVTFRSLGPWSPRGSLETINIILHFSPNSFSLFMRAVNALFIGVSCSLSFLLFCVRSYTFYLLLLVQFYRFEGMFTF